MLSRCDTATPTAPWQLEPKFPQSFFFLLLWGPGWFFLEQGGNEPPPATLRLFPLPCTSAPFSKREISGSIPARWCCYALLCAVASSQRSPNAGVPGTPGCRVSRRSGTPGCRYPGAPSRYWSSTLEQYWSSSL